MVSLGPNGKLWFSLSNSYDDFFFLSQAVWTQQKWISENVDDWRIHKRLKRFASLAEFKNLDANSPSVSGTIQAIIWCLRFYPILSFETTSFLHSINNCGVAGVCLVLFLLLCDSGRSISLIPCGRWLHKGVNISRWGPLEAILEADCKCTANY